MARGQSSKTLTAKVSGTSNIPTILPYPKLIDESEYSGLKNQYCYIIDHYGQSGLALLIYQDNGVHLQVGDWSGKIIDLDDKTSSLYEPAVHLLNTYGSKLVQLTALMRLQQCILYFAIKDGRIILVDVRISLNKFVTPGMLNDVYGKIVETQHIIGVQVLNDIIYESILNGSGEYSGSIILKPNRYKHILLGSSPIPLYVEVLR